MINRALHLTASTRFMAEAEQVVAASSGLTEDHARPVAHLSHQVTRGVAETSHWQQAVSLIGSQAAVSPMASIQRRFQISSAIPQSNRGGSSSPVKKSDPVDPVDPMGLGKISGSGLPNPNTIFQMNALFAKLNSISPKNTLFIMSDSGSIIKLRVTSEETGDNLPFDVLDMFLVDTMELPASNIPEKISMEELQPFIENVPSKEEHILPLILFLLRRMGKHLVMSAGTGHAFFMNFKDRPEGVDSISYVVEKMSKDKDISAEGESRRPVDSEAAKPLAAKNEVESRLRVVRTSEDEDAIAFTLDEILEGFRGLFLNTGVLNRALRAVGLRTFIHNRGEDMLQKIRRGDLTIPCGTILSGHQGTGKSLLMDAVRIAWIRSGGGVSEAKLGQMEDKYVGSLGKNLTALFEAAIEKAQKNQRPTLVIIDEASNITRRVSNEGGVGDSYYGGAIDVIKNYTSNHPEIVLVLATNVPHEFLDPALTRSLRLEVVSFALPDYELRMKMFAHYLREMRILNGLDDNQLKRLVDALPECTGADISKFCRQYFPRLLAREYAKSGHVTELDLIQHEEEGGEVIDEETLRKMTTFETVLKELVSFEVENRAHKAERRQVGFS